MFISKMSQRINDRFWTPAVNLYYKFEDQVQNFSVVIAVEDATIDPMELVLAGELQENIESQLMEESSYRD